MITVPLRDLRNNFSKLEVWLAEGESIQIRKRGELIALLTGLKGGGELRNKTFQQTKPDFAARRKNTWKGRVFTAQEIEKFKKDELEGEYR